MVESSCVPGNNVFFLFMIFDMIDMDMDMTDRIGKSHPVFLTNYATER